MLSFAHRHPSLAVGSLVLALAACGSSVDTSALGGATASTTTTTTTTTTTGGGAGGNPCYPDSCPPTTTSSSSGAGGSAALCGGDPGGACPPDAFCDFKNDDCGGADGPGVCTAKPGGCTLNYVPTCGCDGKIYGNPCDANAHGVDVSNLGGCTPPGGMFSCGAHFCSLQKDYCQRDQSDVVGVADVFTCVPLPAACAMSQDCSCLAKEPCYGSCSKDALGGLTVVCSGG